jgi:acetoin utilization deacetylase AcuC-like enzyme
MKLFVYSPKYKCDIGEHVFHIRKYELLYERLIKSKVVKKENFILPQPATLEDLLLVHSKDYIDDLLNLRLTERTRYSELPLTKEIIDAYILMAGGTILSSFLALETNINLHIGGGWHHAFSDKAEGFCYINDIAIAIRKLQQKKLVKKFAVIDCDLHQGNGTAHIFKSDKGVFTFSIHQENLYPIKQKSSLDIGLDDFTTDDVYLEKLSFALEKIKEFKPEFIIYVAGADIYEKDKLGNLKITKEGIKKRDEMVLSFAYDNKIPTCITLAGGYTFDIKDTVDIHYNTCMVMLSLVGNRKKLEGKKES